MTNNLITVKDHASVQLNIAEVDESGRATGSAITYAFVGSLRSSVRCAAVDE